MSRRYERVVPKVPQISRLLKLRPPPPVWQLFQLKRFCLEGLEMDMFRHPSVLRRALTHQTSRREVVAKHGVCTPLVFLGSRVCEAAVATELMDWKPKKSFQVSQYLLSDEILTRAAKKIGIQYALHFRRNSRGFPHEETLLSQAYSAVVGAVMLDKGFRPALDLVRRSMLSDLKEEIMGAEEAVPRSPVRAMAAELKLWRKLASEHLGRLPPTPRAEMVVEELRGQNSPNSYCRMRIEILGITLGRGDGSTKTRAAHNSMIGALATLGSSFRITEKRDWRHGEVFKVPAKHAIEYLQLLGAVKDSHTNEDETGCIVEGTNFESHEVALKALRSKLEHTHVSDFARVEGVRVDEDRMNCVMHEADLRDIVNVLQAASTSEFGWECNRRLLLGNALLRLFSAEEAFWSSDAENRNIEYVELENLAEKQEANWLKVQRAERLGIVITDEDKEKALKNPGHAVGMERMLNKSLRIALTALHEKYSYGRVRDVLHAITYFN